MGNRKKSEIVFYLSLLIISLLFFCLPVGTSYVLFDDSWTYIEFLQLKNVEGVMPLYPLFLFTNRMVWGKGFYLQAVVVEQTLVAVICVIYFISKIKRRFQLYYKECYLLFLFSLVPFTTEYPLSMVTQDILTEGLSYALFYLLFILLMDAVWERSFGKLMGAFCFTFFLALLRSQMQILFAVCGAVAAYLICVKFTHRTKGVFLLKMFSGLILWIGIMGIGVISVVRMNDASQKIVFGEGKISQCIAEYSQDMSPELNEPVETQIEDFEEYGKKQQNTGESPVDAQSDLKAVFADMQDISGDKEEATGKDIDMQNGEPEEKEDAEQDSPAPNTAPEVLEFLSSGYEESGISVSQYSSMIFSKAMYEADYEDYLLFEDEELQKQFLCVYEIVDELEYRYPYAETGLWGWKHISDSVGALGKHCFEGLNRYFADYYNTTIAYFQYRCTAQAFSTIGVKVLMNHFGSFVWHTIRLMVPAFIFTVFFQKEQFYLLCHLITLFLYVTALGLMIWCFASKKANHQCAEIMLLVLVNNVIMVTAISLVFIGLQRYLVYAFGVFYVAYYLLLREAYKCYIVGRGKICLWKK